MSERLRLLDQALELGQQELACLAEGDVDRTSELARQREALMKEAWETEEGQSSDLQLLAAKLHRLRDLQGELTTEARRLHFELREEIQKTKKKGRGFSGYGHAAKINLGFSNRFINKLG